MGFPRQECWNRLPFPSPGDLPNPGIESGSFALAGGFFYCWATRKAHQCKYCSIIRIIHVTWRRQWQPTPVLLPGESHGCRSLVGCSPWGRYKLEVTERLHFTFHFHTMEKAMASHSSVLAWRIPGTAEPGGLPSMGSHRVRHD